LYVWDEDIERQCLRQGDILSCMPFPIIDKEIAVLGRLQDMTTPYPGIQTIPREHRKQPEYFTAQIKMRMSFVSIISHCCEIEIRNGKLMVPSVAVARIVPVKKTISSDSQKLASLKANKDPRLTNDPGYMDYFYLEPHPLLADSAWVVDFAQIASFASSELETLLGRKVLQLQDRERVKFKHKLVAYLGRLTDEEEKSGLADPWPPPPTT
jgi:hypothetical protein